MADGVVRGVWCVVCSVLRWWTGEVTRHPPLRKRPPEFVEKVCLLVLAAGKFARRTLICSAGRARFNSHLRQRSGVNTAS